MAKHTGGSQMESRRKDKVKERRKRCAKLRKEGKI